MKPQQSTSSGDLDADYADAGFGQPLGFGEHPLVLIIDMVKAYFAPDSPLYAGVDNALTATVALLDAARSSQTPVVFTKVVYTDGGRDGGTFFRKVRGLSLFVGESELGDLADELQRRAAEPILHKRFASAFFDTPLTGMLRALETDTVIIAGLSTSGCVRATAVDAVQLGFIPVVVREAVGDRDARPHEASLFDLDAKYADVVSLQSATSYLADPSRRS